jgi:hypothetical protein
MESLVFFKIEGYQHGKLKHLTASDIINDFPIEDSRFDPYDYGIEEFPNFKNQSNNLDTVLDFEMIFSIKLNEEKKFKTILNFINNVPEFSNFLNKTKFLFEKQFPLCPTNMITLLDFNEKKECGIFLFKTKFPFDIYYKDSLFKDFEKNDNINFGY